MVNNIIDIPLDIIEIAPRGIFPALGQFQDRGAEKNYARLGA
jgi:hypothetical protein